MQDLVCPMPRKHLSSFSDEEDEHNFTFIQHIYNYNNYVYPLNKDYLTLTSHIISNKGYAALQYGSLF